jgi:hypothetical protein
METMAKTFEFVTKLKVVIYLAIVRDSVAPISRGHGLMPTLAQIQDTQPPVPKAQGSVEEQSLIIWPSMRKASRHSPQNTTVNGPTRAKIIDSGYTTHAEKLIEGCFGAQASQAIPRPESESATHPPWS